MTPTTQALEPGDLTKDEFCARFVAAMLALVGPSYSQLDEDGAPAEEGLRTEDYAKEAAPTYWDDLDQRAEGPEACAATDYGYWEG